MSDRVIHNIAVVGAGSWGTTLANLLAENGHRVRIWAREPEVVAGINERNVNPFFASELTLHPGIAAADRLPWVLTAATLVVLAVPSAHVGDLATQLGPLLADDAAVLSLAKGLTPGTGQRLSEMITDRLGWTGASRGRFAVLSGPNLAAEVGARRLGATVIASEDRLTAQRFQEAIACTTFRVYRHTDVIGVELGGAFKNVFAIGAGIVDGLSLGDNAKAAYLTRSLREMIRLGTALGAKEQTFWGLSGLGDLMATANSPLSRNHQLGAALARGETAESWTQRHRVVAEGSGTADLMRAWAEKLTVSAPITEELCRVLFSGKPPRQAAQDLMRRSLKDEEA